jgi:DNA-binding transcriptional MerR regulator
VSQKVSGNINIPEKVYFRIGEVSDLVGVDTHVLRYWESEFAVIKPCRAKSNQRLYRKKDVENLLLIKTLLHGEGYTISGARKLLKKNVTILQSPVQKRKKNIGTHSRCLTDIKKELRKIQQLLAVRSLRY